MSDSNLVKLSYTPETTFAEVPDGTKQMVRMRFTKATLSKKNKTVESDEITGDGQVQEVVKVGVSAGGPVNVEMIADEFNTFFAALLQNPITSVAANIGVSITGQVMSLGTDTVDSKPRYMKVSNCAISGNNGIKKVSAIDNDAHTVTFVAGSFVGDESGTFTLEYGYVQNGVTVPLKSFLIEEEFSNPRQFIAHRGMCVDQFDLNLKAQSKAEGTFTFVGYDGEESDASFGGVRQISQLIFNAKPQNGGNLTITPGRDQHYVFNTVLTHFDGSVLIGATCKASLVNLVAAINLASGGGTTYSSETTIDSWTAAIGATVDAAGTVSIDTLPADGDTVTVGTKVYTFKTNLTPTEGEVKIAGSATLTRANLTNAINHGPGNGSAYDCAAANTSATATNDGSNILLMRVLPIAHGAEGNLIALAKTGSHLTVSGAFLTGGTDSIVITARQSGAAGAVSSFASSVSSGMSGDNDVQDAADPTPASSNPIMNTTSNVGTVFENGVASLCPVNGLTLNVKKMLREKPSIGSEGTQEFGTGDITPTGETTVYFKDRSVLTAFFAHSARSLEFALIDGAGRLINFYLPRIKYLDGAPPVTGKNTDIMLPLKFQAMKDPTTGISIQIDVLDP